MRHAPTLEFIHDALPETARHIDELLAKAASSDAAVAALVRRARRTPATADPYRKPHEVEDDEPDDGLSR